MAVVSLMIVLVMTAVREAEKRAPIHPRTKRLLSPFRRWTVLPAVMLYLISWVYARTTLSRFVVDIPPPAPGRPAAPPLIAGAA